MQMETIEILRKIQVDISDLKKIVSPGPFSNPVSNLWVPEKQVKAFFRYEATQMASFLKSEDLVISKIGKRKFIQRDSIERLLEKNIISLVTNNSVTSQNSI
jgi:5,10-methylene-tetrahydrofolate dehydrogenase/methenyl tetrahydrofolate cyclohydrolase